MVNYHEILQIPQPNHVWPYVTVHFQRPFLPWHNSP